MQPQQGPNVGELIAILGAKEYELVKTKNALQALQNHVRELQKKIKELTPDEPKLDEGDKSQTA